MIMAISDHIHEHPIAQPGPRAVFRANREKALLRAALKVAKAFSRANYPLNKKDRAINGLHHALRKFEV